jgi:chromosome partitioning protein
LPTLVDCDPQGFSIRWLERRSHTRPPIHGIAAYQDSPAVTRTWQLRIPEETRRIIIDSPAALDNRQIHDLIYDATNVIIPVMPSPIDIRYAARFIAELLLVTQLDRGEIKVGIVANRTRKNTKSLLKLMRFLTSLKIPVIANLRDSQNYVAAVGRGIGIYELPDYKARPDIAEMSRIIAWLDRWRIRGEDAGLRSAPGKAGQRLPRQVH